MWRVPTDLLHVADGLPRLKIASETPGFASIISRTKGSEFVRKLKSCSERCRLVRCDSSPSQWVGPAPKRVGDLPAGNLAWRCASKTATPTGSRREL